MDAEFHHSSNDSQLAVDADGNHVPHSGLPEAQCIVCRRAFSLETEVNEGFEAICICRECKIMVLDSNETSVTIRDYHRRRRRRGRSRYGSSESIEDSFSQQFSQLISLVRQNQEAQVDSDATVSMQQRASYSPAQVRVRRWQRTFSDNESESLYQTDSLFGETDSNISFGGYGGESDASLDGHSLLDREIFVQLYNESHGDSDTDIDPMHAGLDQWNSDDQDEEDGEWVEADIDEPVGFAELHEQIQDVNNSPFGSGEREAQGRAWIRWRMRDNQRVHYADIYAGLEEPEAIPPYVGNPGDYLDARGFEELLEQLAETGSARRGAPPAAASFVQELPHVVITKDHEKNGSLVCAVCKDPLPVNTEAMQLPCLHLYHPSCILPWLSTRNSCPVCRYELPTDDQEYEECKRNMAGDALHEIPQQDPAGGSNSDISSDSEADEDCEFSNGRAEQGSAEGLDHVEQGNAEGLDHGEQGSNREGGARRWLFLAAAPIVSIVGIALVLWFRNPVGDRRIQCNTGERDRQQFQRPRGTSAPASNRNRRWWSLM